MSLERDFRLIFGLLLGLQLLTALAAIGLLTRMTPAIESILAENVYSIEAAEEMLLAIAMAQTGEGDPDSGRLFAQALERARANITEPGEIAILNRLEAAGPLALNGDRGAARQAVHGLRELATLNREAMIRADDRAKRLGQAGAWAAAFLGMAGVLTAALGARRFRAVLLTPLAELYLTLEAAGRGDAFRRCHPGGAQPGMAKIIAGVNGLLDERLARQRAQS
jgi:hypothetical protein